MPGKVLKEGFVLRNPEDRQVVKDDNGNKSTLYLTVKYVDDADSTASTSANLLAPHVITPQPGPKVLEEPAAPPQVLSRGLELPEGAVCVVCMLLCGVFVCKFVVRECVCMCCACVCVTSKSVFVFCRRICSGVRGGTGSCWKPSSSVFVADKRRAHRHGNSAVGNSSLVQGIPLRARNQRQ